MSDHEGVIAPLREDLVFFPAPAEAGGEPVWMLQDPVGGEFLRADWAHFELLKRLDKPQTLPQFLQRLQEQTTLRLPPEEVRAFLHDLMQRGLLRSELIRDAKALQQEQQRARLSPLRWFVHHYLYFRIPLLHPDAFLERTAPYARKLVSRPALIALGLLLLGGLVLLSQRLDLYLATATDFLNWKGALAFGLTVACVKGLHEFAHAYAARLCGNRVRSMGLAFIVLWPVPYCDVTDSWRMDSRKKRLLISAAGILCELALAGLSLTLWALSDGILAKSIFFMLSSASLLGTLLVNLNPAMRFDGYYLFCDLTGIDNLFSRAAEFLKWRYRRSWLGLQLPDPEPMAAPRLRTILGLYAVTSWVYRLFLYFGIALVVYHAFPKIIGIVLFALEILLFILRPLWLELQTVWKLRGGIRPQLRNLIPAALLLIGFLWLALPLPRDTRIPALYTPAQLQVVYAPAAGVLAQVRALNGTRVAQGEILAVLRSEPILRKREAAEAEVAAAQATLRLANTQQGGQSRLRELNRQLAGAQARLNAARQLEESCTLRAETAGIVTNWQDTAVSGAMVAQRQELGMICGEGKPRVLGYLPADLAEAVPPNAEGWFLASSGADAKRVRLLTRSTVREKELRSAGLSTAYGGDISVAPNKDNKPEIQGSYFLLQAEETPADSGDHLSPLFLRGALSACLNGGAGTTVEGGQVGALWFRSEPRSHLAEQLRALWRIVLRESGI